jgi:uncharacterized membrane protein
MTWTFMGVTLAAHLVSLTVLAGGGVGATVMHTALSAAVRRSAAEASALAGTLLRFAMTAQLGAVLMLLTGVGLLAERQWADWGRPWLMAKLVLFVLLVLAGPIIARPAGASLQKALAAGGSNDPGVTAALRRLTLFHVIQKTGLISIIVLAVLRPGA